MVTDTLQELQSPRTTERNDDSQAEELRQRREDLIEYFGDFIRETFYQLGAASEEEKDALCAGLLHIGLNEKEIHEWEVYRDTVAERQRASARGLSEQLHTLLDEAQANHYISRESKKRWIQRFRDPALGYKAKEYFVHHQMPEYFSAWEREALKRRSLLKDPRLKSLTKDDMDQLEKFIHGKEFLFLHFEDRIDLNAKVSALLASKELGTDDLRKKAQGMLDAAVKGKFMSKQKVGRWLERIFVKGVSREKIEQFLETTLPAYIANWAKVRTKFDWVEAEIEKKHVPMGMRRLTPEQFLLLSYEQRKSYVDTAADRLDTEHEPSSEELKSLFLAIRHDLDTKDWEEAGTLIAKAKTLDLSERERIEVASLERYLTSFRDNDEEQKTPMEDVRQTLEQMRSAYAELPSSLQPIYLGAMNDGYATATTLFSGMYNRVWCHNHFWLNGSKEEKLEQKAEEETKFRAMGEHGKKGTEAIKLDSVTATEQPAAVRDYQGVWAPTIVFLGQGGRDGFLTKLKAHNENFAFRYWVTIIPESVDYAVHKHIVQDVNPVLKRGMRKLKEKGFLFTLTGPPIGLN